VREHSDRPASALNVLQAQWQHVGTTSFNVDTQAFVFRGHLCAMVAISAVLVTPLMSSAVLTVSLHFYVTYKMTLTSNLI